MEPPNLHQHQEQFTGYFSSLLSLPPPDHNKPAAPTLTSTNTASSHFLSSQNLMLSGNNMSYQNYHQLAESSSTDGYSWPPPPPPHRSSMNVDLESFVANDFLFSKIKDEMPAAETFHNNSNYLTTTTTSGFSSADHHHHYQFYPSSHHHHDADSRKGSNYFLNSETPEDSSCGSRSSYSHVMPSINVLTSDNLCSSLVSSSLDLNLRSAADNHHHHHHHRHLNLTSSSYDGIAAGSSSGLNTTVSRNSSISHHFIGDSPTHSSSNNNNNSKVRKEKLGDRIAALQRLVAPYGKTDTASVLTEAIGYIQFLHDQVQTLSVPYMRSSPNNKPNRSMIMVRNSSEEDRLQHGKGESADLTSRGLCLVSQSFASYLNGYNNVGI
ncbi:unnamed protein product [Linum tenue]|uniref:BHLH domain-containing protein n=1 Tax=Linum tenue TaxID=586396 RepID=A0AAV0I6Q6_9ROSI|nr:unnamed protein product [Linum tenue]